MLAASGLAPAVKATHEGEIARFLHHCEQCRVTPTVEMARRYLADRPAASTPARETLRWLFRKSRSAAADGAAGEAGTGQVSESEARPERVRFRKVIFQA